MAHLDRQRYAHGDVNPYYYSHSGRFYAFHNLYVQPHTHPLAHLDRQCDAHGYGNPQLHPAASSDTHPVPNLDACPDGYTLARANAHSHPISMREIIYGRNPVYESLRARRRDVFRLQIAEGVQEKGRLIDILDLAGARRIPVERVPRLRLDKFSDSHQGVALEVSGYPYVGMDDILENANQRSEALFVLVLDSLQNPQNLGTLIRTAESVGVHGIVIPTHRAAEITPAVVSASAGASEHMLVVQANLAQALVQMKEADAWVVGLDEAGQPLEGNGPAALQGALVVVVGSEGEGIRPLVKSNCDFLLRLPMQGQIQSLNASVAGSVALYLAYLARHKS